MGLVPSRSMFCISVSVTVRPSSLASFSRILLFTNVFQTWSFTWFSSSSVRLSRPWVILMTSWYSSIRDWKSWTLIFSPNTSPTCWRCSFLDASQERNISSAMNANRARPMTMTRVGPQLLIFPIAAIFLFNLFVFSCFFQIQPAKLIKLSDITKFFCKKPLILRLLTSQVLFLSLYS